MSYMFFLDKVALPVAPSKLQIKIKSNNKTVTLINEGEVNILKAAGLSEVSFKFMIPQTQYPFAYYPDGFKPAAYYLELLERLKTDKKPFQFICSRCNQLNEVLFDTNMSVSLEDYKLDEDAGEGLDLYADISLTQYKPYGTKVLKVAGKTATVVSVRDTSTPVVKIFKALKGDGWWSIAKRYLGDGNRWREIYALNKDKVPKTNVPYAGMILTLPKT